MQHIHIRFVSSSSTSQSSFSPHLPHRRFGSSMSSSSYYYYASSISSASSSSSASFASTSWSSSLSLLLSSSSSALEKKNFKGLYIFLYNKDKHSIFPVYFLVASSFIRNPNHYTSVIHKDGNNNNSKIENLQCDM